MFKRRLLLPALVILATFALLQPAPSAQSTLKLPPAIDPQIVRDQDDMTWGDYVPIPGATWNDPAKAASVKTIRLAIVMADFEDQPFVMTLPKKSDKYGNPQVDGIPREQIVPYTLDFYTKPTPDNRGHTTSNGCFRCHDDSHKAADGSTISGDCEFCHKQIENPL